MDEADFTIRVEDKLDEDEEVQKIEMMYPHLLHITMKDGTRFRIRVDQIDDDE